ncbi:HAD-like domain-containing protein [Aspergillus californicus]
MYTAKKAPKYKLVILDFDGTLFDTVEALAHTFLLTFEELMPSHKLEKGTLYPLMSIGIPLKDTLRRLLPDDDRANTFDEDLWVTTFRDLYAKHALEKQTPYAGAKDLLTGLKARGIPVAIVSNKVITVLFDALDRYQLSEYIRTDLVVGDPLYEGRRKPDPAGFSNVLLPRLKNIYGDDWMQRDGDILMVGDTVTDITFARNIGARMCWFKRGNGNKKDCEAMRPDVTVERLTRILDVVDSK